jgi:hypothetical protein
MTFPRTGPIEAGSALIKYEARRPKSGRLILRARSPKVPVTDTHRMQARGDRRPGTDTDSAREVAGSQAACRMSGLTVPAQVNLQAIVFEIKTIIATVVFDKNSDGVIAQAKTDIFVGTVFQVDTAVG